MTATCFSHLQFKLLGESELPGLVNLMRQSTAVLPFCILVSTLLRLTTSSSMWSEWLYEGAHDNLGVPSEIHRLPRTKRRVFTGFNTQETALQNYRYFEESDLAERISARKRKAEDPESRISDVIKQLGLTSSATDFMKNSGQDSEGTMFDDWRNPQVIFPSLDFNSPEPSVKVVNTSKNVLTTSTSTSASNSTSASSANSSTCTSEFTAPFFSALPPTSMTSELNGSVELSLTKEQRNEFMGRTIFADENRWFRNGNRDNVGFLRLDSSISDEGTSMSPSELLGMMKIEGFKSISSDRDIEQGLEDQSNLFGHLIESLDLSDPNSSSINPFDDPEDTIEKGDSYEEIEFDQSMFCSPPSRSKSYDLNEPFIRLNSPTVDHKDLLSVYGEPLRRIKAVSLYDSPVPVTDEDAFELEYIPWFPSDKPRVFLDESFDKLKCNFDLGPMTKDTEIIENPETKEGRAYFPSTFQPFQNYGEFVQDDKKLQGAIENVRGLSAFVTEKAEESRKESLQQKRDLTKSRHEEALKYAIKAKASGLPEGDWIQLILAGGMIDFTDIPERNDWSVERCRHFLCALIPSIKFNASVEELLADFINDLFKRVFLNAIDQGVISEAALSHELTSVARKMIRELISPAIFNSFLEFVHNYLTEDDAECLYTAIVKTMGEFSIPEPLSLPERVAPVQPKRTDPKYEEVVDESIFAKDMKEFEKVYDEYMKLVGKDDRKARYQDEIIKYRNIQKARSFEFLKSLVAYLPGPILNPNSTFVSRTHLAEQRPKHSKKSEERKPASTSSSKSSKVNTDKLIFGPDAHCNQDFFDALFFSRILRAFLILENSVNFVTEHVDPFLRTYQIKIIDSPIGFRFLKAIDKFIKITRFNNVANEVNLIINYRRYLLAYLIRDGASLMGIDSGKVQSRCITLELHSFFESIHLYQVLGASSEIEFRAARLKTLLSYKEISFQMPIIYFIYNPVPYSVATMIIESVSRDVPGISISKLNAYFEIFAMSKNVPLLSIYNRKVLKFKRPLVVSTQSFLAPLSALENINMDLPHRPELPENYEAVFEWNMSFRLKNISIVETHLHYPYGTFASRVLLARQFGVSFDSSHFLPQLSENFTWTECVGFVNFFLEREAQVLIDRAHPKQVDADLYQVYRVFDSQERLLKTRQLSDDEPTHHINLLISRAFKKLDKSVVKRILARHTKSNIFDILNRGLRYTNPETILNVSSESADKILRYFLDQRNVPEAFDIRLFL